MSFLNPISEPVLMYSSTDADAPQINYAARAAGDVKTVLKACLVTGYGTKQGAGWSIQNETDFAAEFKSPEIALSEYTLGINDTSASSNIWYNKYQTTTRNLTTSALTKNPANIDKTKASGWHCIVTRQGVYHIEFVYQTIAKNYMARVIYWGRLKSALTDDMGKNIAFWISGADSQSSYPKEVFAATSSNYRYTLLGAATTLNASFANYDGLYAAPSATKFGTVEISSPVYFYSDGALAAKQPGLLLKLANTMTNFYGVYQTTYNDRPVLYVCAGYNNAIVNNVPMYSLPMMIYLDNWGY